MDRMFRTCSITLAAVLVAALAVGVYLAYAHSSPIAAKDTRVTHYVALTAKGAEPDNLLIKVGEYVEFDSKDGKTHNIASGVGNGDGEHHDHTASEVESGPFAPDEGYLAQFKKVGTFYFHDHENPNINISIGVYDPNTKAH